MPRIINANTKNFTWKISNDELKPVTPAGNFPLMTTSYHNDSRSSSYRVTPDHLTIKTNQSDWPTRMTSRSADPSPQGFLTRNDYREISPRPFESAFKSAIEKMKHSSATRLDMVGNSNSNPGKWSGNRVITTRQVTYSDPKTMMSQSYMPSDTMSDCGFDSTSQENIFPNYKPFSPMKGVNAHSIPRNQENVNRYYRNDTPSMNNEYTVIPNRQYQSHAQPKERYSTNSSNIHDMQSDYMAPINKTPQRYSSDVSLNSSNFWDLKRQASNRGHNNDQNNHHWTDYAQNVSLSYQNPERKVTSVSIRSASTSRLNQDKEVFSEKTVDNTGMNDMEIPLPSVKDIILQVESLKDKENKSRVNVISRPKVNKTEFITPKYQQQRFSTNPSVRNQQYQQLQHSNHINNNVAAPLNQRNPGRTGNTINQLSPITPLRQRDNYSPMKRAEQLSNLPLDYQKLRESFLEQRNEIQRLRKDIANKNIKIQNLQKDLKLYEPWRFNESEEL